MLELGMILQFIPPRYASGIENLESKKRLMLIVGIDEFENTLTLINISKIFNKAKWFTYPSNCLIRNYNPPLPLPSFAKLNDNYIVENVPELKNYIYNSGIKLDTKEFNNILSRRLKYIKTNRIEQIYFSGNEILKINPIPQTV